MNDAKPVQVLARLWHGLRDCLQGTPRFGGQTISLMGDTYVQMTTALTLGQDYALSVRCREAGGGCGRSYGYIFGFFDAKAWSVPLLPALPLTREGHSLLAQSTQVLCV